MPDDDYIPETGTKLLLPRGARRPPKQENKQPDEPVAPTEERQKSESGSPGSEKVDEQKLPVNNPPPAEAEKIDPVTTEKQEEGENAKKKEQKPEDNKPITEQQRSAENGKPETKAPKIKARCFCYEQGMVSDSCEGHGTRITEAHYEKLSTELKVETAVLKAVAKVESRGDGFILDNNGRQRAKILFERHKMYLHLSKKIDKQKLSSLVKKSSGIVNPEPGGYGSVKGQFERLKQAKAIDEEAAIKSCSWGEFQVMGETYKDGGYKTPQELEEAMNQCKLQQFLYFKSYLQITKPIVVQNMRIKNWRNIAYYYNGPNYKVNAYDKKMEQEYNNLIRQKDKNEK